MEVMPIFSILLSEKRIYPAHWHGDNLDLDSMQGKYDLFRI